MNRKYYTICIWMIFTIMIFSSCNFQKKNNNIKTEETTTASETSTEVSTEKKIREKKIKIAIDPGHQKKQMSEQEPIGPGASETKPMVSSGTEGCVTKIPEYEINLQVSLKLKNVLISRGYDVYMIRESNDVSLSNKERAQRANLSGASAFLRIHCNSAESSSTDGALTMCPTDSNPYCGGDVIEKSQRLAQIVGNALCHRTGAKNRGTIETDQMSGINWCTIPVTIVEMGFMSNPEEDRKLSNDDYQNRLANGIADGIDIYMKK